MPTGFLHPWNFPGKSTGVGCHFLLQGIFPTQGSNPGLPHCGQTLYRLSHQGSHTNVVILHRMCCKESLSCVRLFATLWTAACKASLSITNSWSLLKLMSINHDVVMPCNHLILCCPLLLLSSIFPSIRVFSSESVLHIRWPQYWSFSFSISPSNEYSGLISFRMDWLDLLAVQGTFKSLLQHLSLKASVLQHSACFIVQLSHPYMTTGRKMTIFAYVYLLCVLSVKSLSFAHFLVRL